MGTWMGKSTKLGMSVCSSKKQGLFLSVFVDDIKIAGKKQNMAHMWKNLKKLILVNPHHFLTLHMWDVLNVNANHY